MRQILTTTLVLFTMLIALHTQAQTDAYYYPSIHGDGSKKHLGTRSNYFDQNTLQWVNDDSVTFTNNAQGLMQLAKYYIYSTTLSTWAINRSRKFEYNSDGKITSLIDSLHSAGAWSSSRKYLYTFNTNGDETLVEEYKLNPSMVWVKYSRIQTTYNATHKINSKLYQNFISSVWTDDERIVNTYNASDNITKMVLEQWNGSAWIGKARTLYAYFSNGTLQTKKDETFNTATNAYVNFSQEDFTYNANNIKLTEIRKVWDIPTNAWKNQYHNTYTINTQNKIATHERKNWVSSAWVKSYFTTYTYTSSGWCTQYVQDSWNTTTNAYGPGSKQTLTFDANGYNTKRKYESFNTSLSAWVHLGETFHWYSASSFPAGINDIAQEQSKYKVYPNPIASDMFYINAEEESTYKISDMQGKFISNGKINKGKNQIAFSNMSTGTYVLQIGKTAQLIQKN